MSKNYSFICTGLFENLKARFLITWSEMGQESVQAKEVHFRSFLDLIEGQSR